jgi:GcrA cell cycle regulator
MAWTDENRQTLIRLWNEGHNATEIAKELGMNRGMVLSQVRRLRKRGHVLRGASMPPSDPRDLTVERRRL